MKHVYIRKARTVMAIATKTLTQGLALFGLVALVTLLVGPDFTRDTSLSDAQAAEQSTGVQFHEADSAVQSQQRTVAAYLARRYRVAGDAIEQLVQESYAVGRKWKVDPLLILSVMAIESRFNPIAESGYGAKGLMQVVPRFHLDKLSAHGGDEALLEPSVNIQVGVQILKTYIRQTGSLESGLQLYAGAADDPESRYAQKVMAEQERLRRALGVVSARTDI
ncbi:MAG TPA: lytic transglycosylase domain-containing protein [Bryobacteraceae bacterium]|nr:lytic transglycosylase domain-containing protein [Bryobacteraceae bacterium]